MIRQKVTITNPTGLHLRPAGMFCNIASRYKCKDEKEAMDAMVSAIEDGLGE